jgi:DNA-binding XRE family transcriptional regulator
MSRTADHDLPYPALQTAQRLGRLVNVARRARAWTQEDLAAKADVSRITVVRAEKGDASLGLWLWLKLLWACDQLHRLDDLLDPAKDENGSALALDALPTRIQRSRT